MLNQLQKKLLEMFEWLTNFLHENNLRYYMIDGTMLGAARHKGFIPWDDDIDIAMPRDDYEKLLTLLKDDLDHYVVESPNSSAADYVYGISKFYDINTTMTEELKHNVTRGVYIDIFPLDGIGNTMSESLKNYKSVDFFNMLLAMKTSKYRKDRKWWKNCATFIGNIIPVSPKKLSKKLDRKCAEYNYDNCEYVGSLLSTYRAREIMKKDVYGNPTLYKFEHLDVYGPEKYDEYLTILYKDWRKLPPEDKRKSAHDFIHLDVTKSWRD
jgi:lipopolysaccharide cholinephosphotransferase